MDLARQPVRLLLVDSISDNSLAPGALGAGVAYGVRYGWEAMAVASYNHGFVFCSLFFSGTPQMDSPKHGTLRSF